MNQARADRHFTEDRIAMVLFLYNSYKMTDQNTGKSSAGKKRTEGGIPYKERDGTCGK
jgi:hypothetical protein